jgi:CheY-like chemotaxis protein
MSMAKRLHILVVDDDQDLRETLVEALEGEGYSASPARDGEDALFQLRNSPLRPDLILLDLQMPNMNGAEFRNAQLEIDEFRDIPVAILTADADGRVKAASLRSVGFLKKPLKLPQILALIPAAVEQSHATSERKA